MHEIELVKQMDWNELRSTLRFIECKIARKMEYANWTTECKEAVKELLMDRHIVLSQMFRMHVTPQEVERFRMVNDGLMALTTQMFDEHRTLIYDEDNGDLVEFESRLDVDWKAEVIRREEDGEYGSDFTMMIDAINWTEDLEIMSVTNWSDEEADTKNRMDDGTSWAEGCLCLPQLEDIVVCYALHDLCVHKNYTIPDILRIQSYTITHKTVRIVNHKV